MNNIPEQIKICGDILSISCVSATLMQILPPFAAVLTIIWSLIRIYETKTMQKLLKRKQKDDD